MKRNTPAHRDQYTYATGRIRAMELRLLDSAQYSRLYEARTLEDISRILAECAYPQAQNPEASLNDEMVQTYQLIRELMPDKAYTDALLLLHDYHNIKVILKYLSPWWAKPDSDESNRTVKAVQSVASMQNTDILQDDGYELPETALSEAPGSVSADGKTGIVQIRHLFQHPALIEPEILYQALVDRQSDLVPQWAYLAAVKAVRHYQTSYDVSDIDLELDRQAYITAMQKARQLEDPFFTGYMQLRIDLVNIGLLLRTRQLRSGRTSLVNLLVPDGSIAGDIIISLYDAADEDIKQRFAETVYAPAAACAETYGTRGGAAQFGLICDNIQIKVIRRARWTLSGPEVPLAYLIAREMEIKNIRIVLACVRNGLTMSQAIDLARDRYLEWR